MIIETTNIKQVACSILGIDIYWYGILISITIVIGIIYCKKNDGKFKINFNDIINLLIFLLPISIISARIYYCIFSIEKFEQNPIEVFNLRNGGLAIYGGIIGAVITCFIYCKTRKINFINLLDFLAPVLALGQSIGRWGNFFNKEAYGIETNSFLKMEIIENGELKYVHPAFLYESIITFTCFIILAFLSKKRKYEGQISIIYLVIYSFARIIIEELRTDSLMFYNVRISQIISIIIFIIFSSILVCKEIKCRNQKKKENK